VARADEQAAQVRRRERALRDYLPPASWEGVSMAERLRWQRSLGALRLDLAQALVAEAIAIAEDALESLERDGDRLSRQVTWVRVRFRGR